MSNQRTHLAISRPNASVACAPPSTTIVNRARDGDQLGRPTVGQQLLHVADVGGLVEPQQEGRAHLRVHPVFDDHAARDGVLCRILSALFDAIVMGSNYRRHICTPCTHSLTHSLTYH